MNLNRKINSVIIQGSSRSDGDTALVTGYLINKGGIDLVDLNVLRIGPFDYKFKNEDDDFFPTISKVIAGYDKIIFATPVYWYTMSGQMKIFLDRISDLLKIHKETGRQLRGKKMAVLSSSNDNDLVSGFYMPFVESANYLGMEYIAQCHSWVSEGKLSQEVKVLLDDFYDKIVADTATTPD